MSTEPPQAPTSDPTVDPDNFHVDGTTTTAAADGTDTTTVQASGSGTVKPDNFHVDSQPQG